MHSRRGRLLNSISLIAAGACLSWSYQVRAEATETFEPTHSLVGSYLAGRFARSQHDAASAAEFYQSALVHDPSSELLLEQAFQMEASRANWPRALKLAEELIAVQPQHRLARLALALRDFNAGAYKKAEAHFEAAGTGPIGELTSALALAWVNFAERETSAALKQLDLPKQAEWAQSFLRYHRGLIADLAGRRQEAKDGLERAFKQDARTIRTALAYARHAAHAGDRKLANAILKEHLDKAQGEGHPLIRALSTEIRSGKPIPLIVTSPAEGVAEVFYGLGEALIGEGAVPLGILYMQMALYTAPNQEFALAALASAYEANRQYEEAIAVYNRIPDTSPLEQAVEIRKAYNLNSLERVDEARDTLLKLLDRRAPTPPGDGEQQADGDSDMQSAQGEETDPDDLLRLGSRGEKVTELQEALIGLGYDVGEADGKYGASTMKAVSDFQTRNAIKVDGLAGPATFAAVLRAKEAPQSQSAPSAQAPAAPAQKSALSINDQLEVYDALGTIMRSRKLYAEAVQYYDRALALIPKPEKRHWAYFYARGTSYERLKNWPAAEVDLEKALSLYPDQPLVLNYLGYSWIDQGRNLKQGMIHIEKAVALRPDDGYIVDSLGWAHYKQGNFKEAVRYLERAVEIKPDDPVLNDHLGDALWMVGREREARFQWDQALSLKPEPEDAEKIKKKLEQGLTDAPGAAAAATTQAARTDPATK